LHHPLLKSVQLTAGCDAVSVSSHLDMYVSEVQSGRSCNVDALVSRDCLECQDWQDLLRS